MDGMRPSVDLAGGRMPLVILKQFLNTRSTNLLYNNPIK